ncbi:MAG: beta-ketoacyl-ACP synthase III [Bacteroidales bacterium]|nr:beta-ketoacyl-ACP synthase III [Bacteroidales bacterium]
MSKLRAVITGIEAFLPSYVLDNEELATMVDTSDEWIMSRVGIKERRILRENGLGTSFMGEQAVKKLLRRTDTNPDEIQLLICATVSPDMLFPATANIISDKCGILNAWGYDMNAGCSGFLFSFETVRRFIETGQYKKAILVCGERMSGMTDYTDRTTCPLFGDGAVAMLIEPTEDESLGFQDSILHVDGIGRHYLYQTAGGSLYPPTIETVTKRQHYIHQEGQQVFKYAVSRMADVSAEMMQKHNLTADDIAYLIPHQANLRIIDATARRMGLSHDKVLIDIQKFGNTAGTSIPLALWDFKEKFKKGDTLIFSAFGAGFTWGSVLYRWAY